jgi:hypothetical protein
MTANGHFWSVDYNGCVQCPRHRTARTAVNSNKTRQVSLWCFDGHSTFIEPDPNQLRELAYLLQGTGGGGNNSKHRAIWYTTNKRAVSLDQSCCEKLDFCLPWKIAGWQPSSLQSALLPADAVSEEGQPDLLTAQTGLHKLSRRSRDEVPVPDGLVSTALYTFLTALGCGLKHTWLIITQCIHAQLQSICTLTRTRRMRVAEFWQQVGAVTSNKDAVTHARTHARPLCTLPATVFFQVQKQHWKVSETLMHMSLRKQQEVVTASLEGDGLTRVNSIVARDKRATQ